MPCIRKYFDLRSIIRAEYSRPDAARCRLPIVAMLAVHLVGKFASADTLSKNGRRTNGTLSIQRKIDGNRVPFREFAQMQFPLVPPFNSVYPFIRDALFVRDAPIFLNVLHSCLRESAFRRFRERRSVRREPAFNRSPKLSGNW